MTTQHANQLVAQGFDSKPVFRAVTQTIFDYIDRRIAHTTDEKTSRTSLVGRCFSHFIESNDFQLARFEVAGRTPRDLNVLVKKLFPARRPHERQLFFIVIRVDLSPRKIKRDSEGILEVDSHVTGDRKSVVEG